MTQARGSIVGIWVSEGAGRLVARRLLPAVIAILLLSGGLALVGYQTRLIGAAGALALAAVVGTILVTGVLLYSAARLSELDAERQATRTRLQEVLVSSTAVTYATKVVGDQFIPSWVSENITRMMGYGADEALVPTWWYDHVHTEDRSRVLSELPALVADGQLAMEYRFRHKNGGYLWVHDTARMVRDDAGTPTEVFGSWLDISERKQAEDAVRKARDLAEQAAQARSIFLANMSHEIRTPMNAVLGLTELVLDTELTSEQSRQLRLVHNSAEALLTILNDILDFSKIEAEHVQLEKIPFDLPGLLNAAVRLLAVRVGERPVELLCDVHSEVPHAVVGDPGRVRQVLTNLIGNALKFTHEGEVVVSAALDERRNGTALVRFVVRDTGVGIPADKLTTIFDAFGQADVSTTRKYGGTGLGLSISKRLVELMGGHIRVVSEPGHGSEFSFTLPLPVGTGAAAPLQAGHPLSLRGMRVLVVDDNGTNRRIVREMLSTAGLVTDEAGGADEAIERLVTAQATGSSYQLLVIDGHMPGRDGFDLAAQIRADPALTSAVLVMLTSGGKRGDAQRCRDLGIRGYLTKPVSEVELLEAVALVLSTGPSPADVITRYSIQEARRRLRVLLAEDNPVNQEVATAMLRKRGHHVDVVANGQAAVEAVARGQYDLVLMDIQMPVLDGFGATQAIRATPEGNAQRIIALTAHAANEERDRCLAAGMDAYLSKPFKAHQLYAVVEGWAEVQPPVAQVPEQEAPPVDLEGFRRTMRQAGAEEAVDTILDVFVKDAPERVRALGTAVAGGDPVEIARAAHAFKSAAGGIHALALAEELAAIEAAGEAGDVSRARERIERMHEMAEAVLTSLRRAAR